MKDKPTVWVVGSGGPVAPSIATILETVKAIPGDMIYIHAGVEVPPKLVEELAEIILRDKEEVLLFQDKVPDLPVFQELSKMGRAHIENRFGPTRRGKKGKHQRY